MKTLKSIFRMSEVCWEFREDKVVVGFFPTPDHYLWCSQTRLFTIYYYYYYFFIQD